MSGRIVTKQAVEPAQPPLDVDGPDALAWNEAVDVVITSGFGGVYPKGLRVGEVIGVSEVGEVDLLQTATLRAAVDVGRLEQVFVMLWRGPTMDLLYGSEESSPVNGEAGERGAPAS